MAMTALKTLIFGNTNRIARRLIILVIAFSTLITLLISSVQLVVEYRNLRSALDRQLDEFNIYVPSITGSVWDFDGQQIQRFIESLARLPNVDRVQVTSTGAHKQWSAGQALSSGNTITRIYPLVHQASGDTTAIGTVEVVVSLNAIYRQIAAHAASIVLGNALTIFMVAIFMAFLFRQIVTRRLEHLAHKASNLTPTMLYLKQVVKSDPQSAPKHLDELATVEWILGNTAENLTVAASALQRSNDELEQRVAEKEVLLAERKRAEEELKRHRDHLEDLVKSRTAELTLAKEKAEVANQSKSTFLSSMSHELRTPLNAVLGYAQILQRDHGLSERQTMGITTIQQSGEHLLTLINDILDLAKIESGKFELYPTTFNLPLFLRRVGDIVRIKAEEKSLLFEFELQADLPLAILADEKRLRQVLLNLLSNAVKFTDRGQVSLRVTCAPCCGEQARLRVEVQDSGIGISAEQQALLFAPFTQVGDLQRRAGGTGLGLAISRQLVCLMGSEIQFDSQPGIGSRFWFEISVAAEAELTAIPLTQTITGYAGARKKVLIVDDVAANRAMLVDLLSDLGFDTTEAVNGEQGWAQAQAIKPDLLIMDMVMPVMDGPEAMRRIRQTPDIAALPIIAVSASASEEDQTQNLAAGANVFLSKPIEAERLLQQIGSLLELTWTVEEFSAAVETVIEVPLVAPPRAELEALHALALIGNMRDILLWVEHLESLGELYRPFAGKLRHLANGYQSKAILDLVKKYRGRAPDS